nr:hypothetical protein [Bdellovibrionales bacterium]
RITDMASQVLNPNGNLTEVTANLAVLRKALSELKTSTPLSADEDLALSALNSYFGAPTAATQEEKARAYLRTLNGPLSRTALKKTFPGVNTDRIDYGQLYAALENGGMDAYLYLSRLSSFLEFLQLKSFVPRFLEMPDGHRTPIDNKPFDLEPPQDLNSFQNYFLNGPPALTAERFLSGDILEMTYREDRQVSGITKEKDRVVTVMVYDISGSMRGHRAAIQGALMASFADRAQQLVQTGAAEHVIYAIPFGVRPGNPERIEGTDQFFRFFESKMQATTASESDTKFTAALNEALKFIGQESVSNPALKRANILFLTDGADPNFRFAQLEAQRRLIDPSIELSMACVAIEQGNEHMTEAIKDGSALKVFDRFQYRHLTKQEIQNIFTREAMLRHLESLAQSLQHQGADLRTSARIALNQSLLNLEVRRLGQFNWDHLEIDRVLQSYVAKETKTELDRVFEILFASPIPEEISKANRRIEKLNLLEQGQDRSRMWNAIGSGMHARIQKWVDRP